MDSASERRFAPGDVPGRYRVEAYIARGDVAQVYRAWDLTLQQLIALKVIPFRGDSELVQRLWDQAKIAAQIDHPNVVDIREIFFDEDDPCAVMRYVRGAQENTPPDLATALHDDNRRFTRPEVLDILEQVANALDAAHGKGIVHHDVRPEHILLDRNRSSEQVGDRVFLVGFGSAEQSAQQIADGCLVDMVNYVAPEAFRGEALGRCSDVYSLGCVAFEMLTGEPPYSSDDTDRIRLGHLNEPVPKLSERGKNFPRKADAVLERALAKDPTQRTSASGDFVAQLRKAIPPPKPLWWVVVLVTLFLAGVFWMLWAIFMDGRSAYPDYSDANKSFTLERPSDWTTRHNAEFDVLSPLDLRGLFEEEENDDAWDSVGEQLTNAPSHVVGLYIKEHAAKDDANDAPPLSFGNIYRIRSEIIEEDLNAGSRVGLLNLSGGRVAGLDEIETLGEIRAPNSTDVLKIRSHVVILNADNSVIHLVFFAPPGTFDEHEDEFDRVLDSFEPSSR